MWAALWLCRAAAAQADGPKTVKLTFQGGRAMGVTFTPSKVVTRGRNFNAEGSHARIRIGGESRLVAARFLGSAYAVAADCDGDDKISAGEWVALEPLFQSASFLLKLSDGDKGRPYAVRFFDVRIGVRLNQVVNFSGRMTVDCSMAGSLDGQEIRLVDDNLDGKFTQDGKDAIAVGGSPGAMPLYKNHQVGGGHYELDVASDGTSVSCQPLKDLKLALVEVRVPSSTLRCMVIVDETAGRSYDLRANGSAGVPEGSYKLSYAVLASGKRLVIAKAGPKALTYTVTADMVNTLRFGAPAKLTFRAHFDGLNDQIRVNIPITPFGIGGEEYDLRFAGRRPYRQPHIILTNGRAVLSDGHMDYNDQDQLIQHNAWIPPGLSRKTGKVVMTVDLPVLGRAAGAYAMSDILEGKAMAPPVPKAPAVVTRKLPAGTALGKQPPKPAPKPVPAPPKPVARRPRPKVASRPVKPAPPDPEYEAEALLNVAKAFLKQDKTDLGVAKLNEIVKKYPGTAAAKKADGLLLDIEIRAESK